MKAVDGGDVGEDEPHHVLGEGLAAARLPQQLLEEHLCRGPYQVIPCLRRNQHPHPPAQEDTQLQQSQISILVTALGEMARGEWIPATLQPGRQASNF